MVNLASAEYDLLFYALSDPTRRRILGMINDGTQSISALAQPFRMSLAGVSKHIKILEKAGLLSRKKVGRINECTLNLEALRSAEACIRYYTRFWNERLEDFARNLEASPQQKTKPRRK